LEFGKNGFADIMKTEAVYWTARNQKEKRTQRRRDAKKSLNSVHEITAALKEKSFSLRKLCVFAPLREG